MKILFFGSYYFPYLSGITTYPRKILSYLAKENEVTALTFKHDSSLKTIENIDGVDVIRMPYLFRISKGFISLRSWWYFFKYARKNDVIFLNIPNAEGLPLAFFGRVFGKRVISIFHCRVDLKGGLFARFAGAVLNTIVYFQLWLSNEIVIYTQDYFNHLSVEKKFAHKTKQVFPPVERLPVSVEKMLLFEKEKGKTLWIGFAGRVAKEKGIDILIEATDALQKKNKNKKIKIIFAGPYGSDVIGEEKYYEEIHSKLIENKIDYTFLGSLHSGDLGAFFSTIDVLVLPSTNRTEAFGMVQVEAMQLGTPVIASDIPGVRVPIQETGMGIVIKPGDVSALTEALEKVLFGKPIVTTKMTHICHEKFDVETTFEFYKSILSDGHRQ